jgi:hypothetical protein
MPKETETTNHPTAGSPVTIGGGAGLENEAFILFDPRHWHCDCANGRLTLKVGGGVITSIEVERNGRSDPIPADDVKKIGILFD